MFSFLLQCLHTSLKRHVKGYKFYFVFTGKENELDSNSNDQGASGNISNICIYGKPSTFKYDVGVPQCYRVVLSLRTEFPLGNLGKGNLVFKVHMIGHFPFHVTILQIALGMEFCAFIKKKTEKAGVVSDDTTKRMSR